MSYQRTDVLVVLGAGASAPAGVPRYSEWRSLVEESDFPILFDIWNRGFPSHYLEDLVDAVRLAIEIDVLPSVNEKPSPQWPKIQPVDWAFMRDFDMPAFEAEVRGFIARRLSRLSPPKYYISLAEQLVELTTECDQRVTVLSSNWDTLLETALEQVQGFREMGLDIFRGNHHGATLEVQVCKPHGSLGVAFGPAGQLRHVPLNHWDDAANWSQSRPLVALPGVGKRSDLTGASHAYTKRSWAAAAHAFAGAGVIISLGFAWAHTDRDLFLLAREYPGSDRTVCLFNNGDMAAASRAKDAFPQVASPETILAQGGVDEAVASGIERLAMERLVRSHHGTALTPRSKDWMRKSLPEVVARNQWYFNDE